MLSRLHDFGFRGCTCMEQSVLGGLAHLLSFEGSDTMSACYYGKEILNGGKPIGFSIPASEHSVMTSYESEVEAVKKICNEFGSGLFSVVMDAYDYDVAIDKHLKEVAEIVRKSGGTFVIRPDSGDAVEQGQFIEEGIFAGQEVRDGAGARVLRARHVVHRPSPVQCTSVR